MSQIFSIPLDATPQTFTITLGGRDYQLTLVYRNIEEAGWILDIDDTNGNAILHGIPLVTGANLLGQYAYLELGGGLYVQTTSDPDAVPGFSSLGDDSRLYWVTA